MHLSIGALSAYCSTLLQKQYGILRVWIFWMLLFYFESVCERTCRSNGALLSSQIVGVVCKFLSTHNRITGKQFIIIFTLAITRVLQSGTLFSRKQLYSQSGRNGNHFKSTMVGAVCSNCILGMDFEFLLMVFKVVFFLCREFLAELWRWRRSFLISPAYFPNVFSSNKFFLYYEGVTDFWNQICNRNGSEIENRSSNLFISTMVGPVR